MSKRQHKRGYLHCDTELKNRILNTHFGAVASVEKTTFTSFITEAQAVKLEIFDHLADENPLIIQLEGEGPIYTQQITGDLLGKYYRYKIKRNNLWHTVLDPWALSMTANSQLAMICDHSRVVPEGFHTHKRPQAVSRTASILYETHIVDHTTVQTNHQFKGKYLGVAERGTSNSHGEKTGLDHLIELGITHLHLLPLHDMGSVDEVKGGYNWGYDPMFYLCPEGVYATDPVDGKVRVLEMKQMIQSIHEAGIHVVLDVVYNHTYIHENHPFEVMAPGWFYRKQKDGTFSNGSGCGNETASESPIFQKLVLDSLRVYLEDYQVDGFRFDLLALHDRAFVNEIERLVKRISPEAILYGEPWMGGKTVMPKASKFMQKSQQGMAIAVFNDHIRNAIKGDNDGLKKGFVSGGQRKELDVIKGIAGAIHYSSTLNDYALYAGEAINYVSCHDNLCLLDKLIKVHPSEDMNSLSKRSLMALSIVLWSFGTPFIQGGTELLRTKYGDHNSFVSGAEVNGIQWDRKTEFSPYVEGVKRAIMLRKEMKVLQEEDPQVIRERLTPLWHQGGCLCYRIQDHSKTYWIAHNASSKAFKVSTLFDEALVPKLIYNSQDYELTQSKTVEEWTVSPLASKVWVMEN